MDFSVSGAYKMIISLATNRNCRGSKGLFYLNADKLEVLWMPQRRHSVFLITVAISSSLNYRPHSIKQSRACALQNRNSSIGKSGLYLQAAPA